MHQRFEIAFRAVAIAATATAGLALVACASAPENYGTAGMAGPQAFTLSSPAFRDGGNLETRHAGNLKTNPNCVGSNVSPALSWSNAPAGTRSLAFVVVDPDGRSGLGVVHWVAYGIAPSVTGFAENEVAAPSPKYVGGKSAQGLPSYMGPCPPAGSGVHHYNYTLIATDLDPADLPPGLTRDELFAKLVGHAKGSATIIGRYGRP